MAIIDEKANIVQSYEYSAFGECLSGKDAVNAFRFGGGYGVMTDDDTGLQYVWNRWRDASTGGWISEDPIRWQAGTNHYQFVGNNPTTFIDPNGLEVAVGVEDVPKFAAVGIHTGHAYLQLSDCKSGISIILEGWAQVINEGPLSLLTSNSDSIYGNLIKRAELGTRGNPTVISSPFGDSEEGDKKFRAAISNAYNRYQNDVPYVLVPTFWGANSNSFVGSILRASGSSMTLDLVGWGTNVKGIYP